MLLVLVCYMLITICWAVKWGYVFFNEEFLILISLSLVFIYIIHFARKHVFAFITSEINLIYTYFRVFIEVNASLLVFVSEIIEFSSIVSEFFLFSKFSSFVVKFARAITNSFPAKRLVIDLLVSSFMDQLYLSLVSRLDLSELLTKIVEDNNVLVVVDHLKFDILRFDNVVRHSFHKFVC